VRISKARSLPELRDNVIHPWATFIASIRLLAPGSDRADRGGVMSAKTLPATSGSPQPAVSLVEGSPKLRELNRAIAEAREVLR
jgi:hypothetical protein